jgi:hypothetical protein
MKTPRKKPEKTGVAHASGRCIMDVMTRSTPEPPPPGRARPDGAEAMREDTGDGEDIELMGGPHDGTFIRYGTGEAPPDRLTMAYGGTLWVYERTDRRTKGGAAVYQHVREFREADGPRPA